MSVRLLTGDCRELLRTLPDESVHCCVTSPPYFGLRCYGHPDQIGLEPTPDAYVAEMVAVFREVKRVLRTDGVCFLNLGDSYCSNEMQMAQYELRNDLSLKEIQDVALAMFGVWITGDESSRKRVVPEVLFESVQNQEIFTQSALASRRVEEKLSEAPSSGNSENIQAEQADQDRRDSSVGRQMRLLWGDDPAISDLGPHQRGWCGPSEEDGAVNHSDLSASASRGISETQISRPVFQLQLRDRIMGLLSARKFTKSEVPTSIRTCFKAAPGLKPKDLVGIPWRVAFALQADGWYLRQDIIWCLSGGTRVYARTQKGEMPMTIKDMVRLDPSTVQLWNGEKWAQVLGWNETPRPDQTYEIELRNGQRIGCTAGHLWPTQRGNVRADEIRAGDVISICKLPEPVNPKAPAFLDDEMVGWFVGTYIAEGSRFDGTIQIASHTKESDRFSRLDALATAYHGTSAIHKTSDNGCTVAINGPILNGIIDAYVSGAGAAGKHLHPRSWQRSDRFLRAVLDGYLAGDGHYDAPNNRWRLGFTSNDELVADLRTICARLGVSVRLKRHVHTFDGREFPGYRGEIRFARSDHHNSKPDGEVIEVRESRARKFWDIGVADEPHLFALASGVLTHNSKPNPMPESVTDRCTKAHEYLFLLAKSERYYFDQDAIAELSKDPADDDRRMRQSWEKSNHRETSISAFYTQSEQPRKSNGTRNKRSVWEVTTQPFTEAHFATFPPALIAPCIKAGTSERGCCAACGAPMVRVVERGESSWAARKAAGHPTTGYHASDGAIASRDTPAPRDGKKNEGGLGWVAPSRTTGWSPSCACLTPPDIVPCRVLDPFAGAGTTGLVADRLQRNAILIELNPAYAAMGERRITDDAPLFAEVVP